MTSIYKTNNKTFDKEELEWAINLMEKEYDRPYRNTPEKMAALISENFDVECSPSQIYQIFGLEENYELENKKIEIYAIN